MKYFTSTRFYILLALLALDSLIDIGVPWWILLSVPALLFLGAVIGAYAALHGGPRWP